MEKCKLCGEYSMYQCQSCRNHLWKKLKPSEERVHNSYFIKESLLNRIDLINRKTNLIIIRIP